MTKSNFGIILIFILFSSSVSAQQKFTVATFDYMFSPNNTYEETDTTSYTGYFSGSISYPIVLNDKSTIITGIRGNSWTVKYDPEQIWPTNFYSLGLTLGYNHNFSEDKSFVFILLPRLNSDYKSINSNALQLGFLTTYNKRSSEKFLWKVGVYFNTEFFGPFVVPLFGLNWNVSEKLYIAGDLPIWAKINYQVSKPFALGVGYKALVGSYRLSGDFNDAYTSRFAIEPYFYLDFEIAKNIYLNGKAGYTMGRKYPVYAKDDQMDWQLSFVKFGDDRTQLNPVIDDGIFFEFGIAYKVDVPD
jgi:hypothetical protein